MNLQKGRFGDCGLAAFMIIKSTKNMEKKKQSVRVVGIAYLPIMGTFMIYRKWFTHLSLIFGKKIS